MNSRLNTNVSNGRTSLTDKHVFTLFSKMKDAQHQVIIFFIVGSLCCVGVFFDSYLVSISLKFVCVIVITSLV